MIEQILERIAIALEKLAGNAPMPSASTPGGAAEPSKPARNKKVDTPAAPPAATTAAPAAPAAAPANDPLDFASTTPDPPATAPAAPPVQTTPPPSAEALGQQLVALSKAYGSGEPGRAKAIEVLSKFGVAKIGALDPAKYVELAAAITAALPKA